MLGVRFPEAIVRRFPAISSVPVTVFALGLAVLPACGNSLGSAAAALGADVQAANADIVWVDGDTGPSDDAATGNDTAATADTADTADTSATVDTAPDGGGDGVSTKDSLEETDGNNDGQISEIAADAAGGDAVPGDGGGSDGAVGDAVADGQLTDSSVGDSSAGDGGASDGGAAGDGKDGSASDAGSADLGPELPPGGCATDADCAGLSFSPCLIGSCNATSKMCQVKPAVDGTTCSVPGSCGGPGTCKSGGCNAPSTCKPDACAPVPMACNSKLDIDLSTLGPGLFKSYGNCSYKDWPGPEAAVVIASDVTLVATLSYDVSGVTTDVEMFDVYPTADGKCDAQACDNYSGYSLTLGLGAGKARVVVIDTLAADTGIVTLSLECTAATFCGDQVCDATESCAGCPGDCGACTSVTCGDTTCGADENCATCPGDCGVCPAGCYATDTAGCGGCACEACVCQGPDGDPLCCSDVWDSICVSECSACLSGGCPPWKDVCGDKICGDNEDSTSCPADCGGAYMYCGDGLCATKDAEDCKGCPEDCGFCPLSGPIASGCGDGKCSGDENCTNCTADCGVCGDYTCACKDDPTCCTSGFDYSCQDSCITCIAAAGGGSCPIANCGDGICAGETCKSCSTDCGDCAPYCGDGNCDSGEDATNCVADCGIGCFGKCGKKSKDAGGKKCYCDSICTSVGDCCPDKATYCP